VKDYLVTIQRHGIESREQVVEADNELQALQVVLRRKWPAEWMLQSGPEATFQINVSEHSF
jgi:hypothetical protein